MNKKNRNPLILEEGSQFGNLIILSNEGFHKEPSGHRRSMVKVKCKCSREFITISSRVKNGYKTECGKCSRNYKLPYQIGQKYDNLTIIDFINDEKKLAICKCICGNIKKIRPSLLTINQNNNCGCIKRGRWKGIGNVSLTRYNRIKKGASIRGIPFEVSHEYIADLLEKQGNKCAISGLVIGFGEKTSDKFTASLDRIDSAQGYIIGNIQWVHVDINLMKMNLNEKYFLDLCGIIAEYNKNRKIYLS